MALVLKLILKYTQRLCGPLDDPIEEGDLEKLIQNVETVGNIKGLCSQKRSTLENTYTQRIRLLRGIVDRGSLQMYCLAPNTVDLMYSSLSISCMCMLKLWVFGFQMIFRDCRNLHSFVFVF